MQNLVYTKCMMIISMSTHICKMLFNFWDSFLDCRLLQKCRRQLGVIGSNHLSSLFNQFFLCPTHCLLQSINKIFN